MQMTERIPTITLNNGVAEPALGLGVVARPHGKSPAQVMLRWHLQKGRSAIPKSIKPARIAENLDI